MRYLYVCEQGSTVGNTNGRIEIRNNGTVLKSVPEKLIDAIALYGNIQMTAQCIAKCLKTGIHVIYYSMNGTYYGRLISPNHVDVELQRMQANMEHNNAYKLQISKRIISAKIHNQMVTLRKHMNMGSDEIERTLEFMKKMKGKVELAKDAGQLMGFEGISARYYFQELGRLAPNEFAFTKRSKRPPKDPYNALLSLGYSMISNELYGKIESRGLNPYFGLMHKDKEKHPSLVSDLIEEWRPVLVDSTALAMLRRHELSTGHFCQDDDAQTVTLTKEGLKCFVSKIEEKMRTRNRYISYINMDVSFREAMDYQIDRLIQSMETDSPDIYCPIKIR